MSKNKKNKENGYLSLCYHYLRPEKIDDPFPKILGNSRAEFLRHIKTLLKRFQFIGEEEAYRYSYSEWEPNNKTLGLLMTFDDGLSDHYWAAKTLAEKGIRGIFFIPTCIITDNEPANPIIIHYCIAEFGISAFLSSCQKKSGERSLKFIKGIDNPWQKIAEIKYFFKYDLDFQKSREILLHVYRELFLKKYPNAMEIMHLTKHQIQEIIAMGHSVGVHSHTHLSLAGSGLSEEDFKREIILPKKYLENECGTKVISMSYPFGSPKDCLNATQLKNITNEYSLAFTVDEIVNRKTTSPFELGRYIPTSTDTEKKLLTKLEQIMEK